MAFVGMRDYEAQSVGSPAVGEGLDPPMHV